MAATGSSLPSRSSNLNGFRTLKALPNYNSIVSPLSLEIVPVADDASSSVASDLEDRTTSLWQTYIHLVKGYIGVGCLSLPWALSQLGIPLGCLSLALMSYWSSYNCWTIVRLKRFIERQRLAIVADGDLDLASDLQSNKSYASSQLTYPEVGEWFFGLRFHSYVAASICTQQLAICTVFLSFIGENLLAVLQRLGWHNVSHATVMTLALPPVLLLSFSPNLRTLAPVMMVGTVLLLGTFCALAVVIIMVWADRPDKVPEFSVASAPLALCAILYSYEGICLILPVESAMKEPQHFQAVFSAAMGTVAVILATVASSCVMAFGQVTNGSVTAFLLQIHDSSSPIFGWLLAANTLVSLSVLVTLPLQLFPAVELVAPWWAQTSASCKGLFSPSFVAAADLDEKDLAGFEPLPPLPEHELYEHEAEEEGMAEHHYDDALDNAQEQDEQCRTGLSSILSFFPTPTIPGDSPQLRTTLVLLTYTIAVVVPNVQSLISLAGAVTGSSTALLIPPLLELAWLNHLENDDNNKDDGVDDKQWFVGGISNSDSNMWLSLYGSKWWKEKLKCWILLLLGSVFCGIGTYASMADVIAIYTRGGR